MIQRGFDLGASYTARAEAIVVGSGAGGAVMAKELAARGWDVLVVEAGGPAPREEFNGRTTQTTQRFYYRNGMTAAIGRPGIVLPIGQALGGTTVVNSGTCFRIPERVYAKWQGTLGLAEFSAEAMAGDFAQVEEFIHAGPVPLEIIGNNGHLAMRGAKAIGLHAKPLSRNALDCVGSGLCPFGCPRAAKQSMQLNYIPVAHEHGARFICDAEVTEILTEGSAVVGVRGFFRHHGKGPRTGEFTFRAPVVVLSAGAILTPDLLLRNRLANSSGHVGRHLHIHPALKVFGLFDEEVHGLHGVPQSVYIDDFHDEGMLFESVYVPPYLASLGVPGFGAAHRKIMRQFDHLATFGVMVTDTSEGRVTPGVGDTPFIRYDLNRHDTGVFHKGMKVLSDIWFAAGAKRVFPMIPGIPYLDDPAATERLMRYPLKPTDLELIAFHPMGTCRVGVNHRHSVLKPTLETWDVNNLFVVDGSVFPSSLGVNPQLSIMAFATRTARYMDAHKGLHLGRARVVM